jgi:uncharacterized membrane protein YedE/YeeE
MHLLLSYGTGQMAALHNHDTAGLLFVLGIILVLGCLAGAAYMAYLRNALAAILLLVVAIVAAYLLL